MTLESDEYDEHPLVRVAYARWKHMEWKDVLCEMAYLFHLAVQIEAVRQLEALRDRLRGDTDATRQTRTPPAV